MVRWLLGSCVSGRVRRPVADGLEGARALSPPETGATKEIALPRGRVHEDETVPVRVASVESRFGVGGPIGTRAYPRGSSRKSTSEGMGSSAHLLTRGALRLPRFR